MKVAVEEWELYNNGFLLCKWYDLEDYTIKEIEDEIREIKKGYDLGDDLELFVADVEDDPTDTIKGDENLIEAYKIQELIQDLEDYDLKKVDYMVNQCGYDLKDAIDRIEDCDIYEDITLKDLAYEFIEQGLFGDISESIAFYIDYDLVARDLGFDYCEFGNDVFRCN